MARQTRSPIDAAIGQKLRSARAAKGVTQDAVAQALGVTFQQIQKYETGQNRLSAAGLLSVCNALDVEPAAILPRLMKSGAPAPDPFAALGATIGGYELAQIYSGMTQPQRESLLSVAKAIASASMAAAA